MSTCTLVNQIWSLYSSLFITPLILIQENVKSIYNYDCNHHCAHLVHDHKCIGGIPITFVLWLNPVFKYTHNTARSMMDMNRDGYRPWVYELWLRDVGLFPAFHNMCIYVTLIVHEDIKWHMNTNYLLTESNIVSLLSLQSLYLLNSSSTVISWWDFQ